MSLSGATRGELQWKKDVLREYILPLLIVGLSAVLLYLPIRNFKFSIIDDTTTIFQNPYLGTPGAQDIGYLWRHSYYALYMPVTYTLWGLLARIDLLPRLTSVPPGGINASYLNPAVFHLASIVLHSATSALVFLILRRLQFRSWPSVMGAVLFAAHPVQVQSVAWITGMNNLTGGFFGFLAIYLYLCQVPNKTEILVPTRQLTARQWTLLVLATMAFVAALLSKPTATLTPLLVIAIEYFGFRRPARRWLPLMLAWSALSIVCAVLVWFTSKPVSSRIWSPVWGRPFIVGDSLAFYLTKAIFPARLTLDYGRSPHQVLEHWWGYLTWVVPALLVLALLLWRRKQTPDALSPMYIWCLTGLALFVAGLLPVLGLVPFYTQKVSTVCDRYMYSALLGPAVIVAALLSQPLRQRTLIWAIFGVAIALYAYQTESLLPAWRDMTTQTNEMLEHNPTSAMAHQNEGMILLEQGHLDLALPEFQLAMKYDPEADNHAYFTGIALESLGRQEEAVAPLQKAFELDPSVPHNWYELWNVLTYLKRLNEAETVVRRHLEAVPQDGMAQFTLGKTLAVEQKATQALPYLEMAAKSRPNEGAVQFFLGSVYEQLGRTEDALQAYERADSADPSRSETLNAITRMKSKR